MKTQISNRNDLTVYLIYTLLFALFLFKMFNQLFMRFGRGLKSGEFE